MTNEKKLLEETDLIFEYLSTSFELGKKSIEETEIFDRAWNRISQILDDELDKIR